MYLSKENKRILIKKGFTLIELLVVIAIIGLLSSVVLVSLNRARAKSRDARRMADLKQMQLAIEMYYDDNGFYPNRHAFTTSAADGCGSSWCSLETDLASYIAKLPRDPNGLQDDYRYYYDGGGANDYGYGIMCRFEYSSNFPLVGQDGGYYNDTGAGRYYEIGPEPSYDANLGINWWAD